MSAADPRAVVYTAALAPWYRTFAVLVGAGVSLLLGWALFVVVFGVTQPLWLAAVPVALLLAFVIVVVIRGAMQRFRVTESGVEMRGMMRTRRFAWSDIAVVEVERGLTLRGATVIVTRDGRRHRSPITAARWAIRRGESTADHGQDLLQPARPTGAAIAAHRMFLSGERAMSGR